MPNSVGLGGTSPEAQALAFTNDVHMYIGSVCWLYMVCIIFVKDLLTLIYTATFIYLR